MGLVTCTPDADADLAGVAATIRSVSGLCETAVLDFLDGSALEVRVEQIVTFAPPAEWTDGWEWDEPSQEWRLNDVDGSGPEAVADTLEDVFQITAAGLYREERQQDHQIPR